jgi:hypothetical protein
VDNSLISPSKKHGNDGDDISGRMILHFDPFCIFATKSQVAELVALRLLPLMQAALG